MNTIQKAQHISHEILFGSNKAEIEEYNKMVDAYNAWAVIVEEIDLLDGRADFLWEKKKFASEWLAIIKGRMANQLNNILWTEIDVFGGHSDEIEEES